MAKHRTSNSMPHYFQSYLGLCLLAVMLSFSNCTSAKVSTKDSTINPQQARALSDAVMNDLVNERRDEVYKKMEKEFRNNISREQFAESWEYLFEQYGKITSYEYVRDEVGTKIKYNGQTKQTHTVFYDVTTTKQPKGYYQFSVAVVTDDDEKLGIDTAVFIKWQ